MSAALHLPTPTQPYTRIRGVGSYRPTRSVSNDELCQWIDSNDEWIRTRSGIQSRRFADSDETVVSMGAQAACKALAASGVNPAEVDSVIVATFTHTHHTPAAAPEIAHRIGATSAAAFDLNAACAGFSYALSVASDSIRAGSARTVLVIGSEKVSPLLDLHDRSTAFLFGDGAGAVVVSGSYTVGIAAPAWGSDGSQRDAITAAIPTAAPGREVLPPPPAEAPRGTTCSPWLAMAGQSVFRWAVTAMVPVAHQALQLAGISPEQLDVFIPHQANTRIIDSLVKSLHLPEHVQVARDLAHMGNTSAASIPLAMEAMLATGAARSGDTALLLGFGAGLAHAGQVVTLP